MTAISEIAVIVIIVLIIAALVTGEKNSRKNSYEKCVKFHTILNEANEDKPSAAIKKACTYYVETRNS